MHFKILFIMVLILSLAGCATTSRRGVTNIKTQQLETRIRQLERDVELRDKRIRELENRTEASRVIIANTAPEKKIAAANKEIDISNATPKKIQAALKKAGFYNGSIDGKIGDVTKKSIREFQKANGLNADGVVGKKTWARLQKYLD